MVLNIRRDIDIIREYLDGIGSTACEYWSDMNIIREYLDGIGSTACEYWSDKDREKALKCLKHLELNTVVSFDSVIDALIHDAETGDYMEDLSDVRSWLEAVKDRRHHNVGILLRNRKEF